MCVCVCVCVCVCGNDIDNHNIHTANAVRKHSHRKIDMALEHEGIHLLLQWSRLAQVDGAGHICGAIPNE